MTSLEKAILQNLKKSLLESTKTEWKSGYLEDWADFAGIMINTINNSVAIMDAMLNEPTEPEKEP